MILLVVLLLLFITTVPHHSSCIYIYEQQAYLISPDIHMRPRTFTLQPLQPPTLQEPLAVQAAVSRDSTQITQAQHSQKDFF